MILSRGESSSPTKGYNLASSEESLPFLSNGQAGQRSKSAALAGHFKSTRVWMILLSISLALNFYLAVTPKPHSDIGRSRFSKSISYCLSQPSHKVLGGLGYDVPVVYHAVTDYWSDNETLADELWDNIDTSPMGVALSDDYAQSHGLPIASRFPWDDEKGTYFLKAFHQLHCLVGSLSHK